MKSNPPIRLSSDSSKALTISDSDSPTDPMGKDDLLWDLLGEASEQKPNVFFTRNVVRETRKLAKTQPSWRQLISNVLSTKKVIIPIVATACIALAIITQHQTSQPVTSQSNTVVESTATEDDTALTDLVINESLTIAADDPSQFTHDEIVAMIGL
ncbi:MAG: hypothetical protein HN759_11765 [Akkermansiaceae bacterium]|nr:hypothetical protein [Akkermansiaceae bacterium]